MTTHEQTAPAEEFWKRLLQRWFVEYNPFYIVSAGLVVVGVNLISSSLTGASTLAQLGAATIAEVYAWALIGAAAWLTRTGCRRPAVMLALIVAVYQCDPTLHSETCAYLGLTGIVAAGVWLASFVGKLYALAWALHLRPSRTAIAIPTFGAIGLLTIPRYVAFAGTTGAETLIACWVFALFAWGLWTTREIASKVELDAWGETVLRRATRATWLIWAVLGLSHAVFWLDELELGPRALLPVALLLSTRWLGRELGVWCVASATVIFVGLAMPSFFSVTAFLAAGALALRAMREPVDVVLELDPNDPGAAYRSAPFDAPPLRSTSPSLTVFAQAGRPALTRLFTGSVSGVYLSLWTATWTGGTWPTHQFSLDLILTAALILLIWKARSVLGYLPLLGTYLHLGIQTGVLTASRSKLEWGITSVGLGFALLSASLVATWRLRKAMR
jgi:hypothetical protein